MKKFINKILGLFSQHKEEEIPENERYDSVVDISNKLTTNQLKFIHDSHVRRRNNTEKLIMAGKIIPTKIFPIGIDKHRWETVWGIFFHGMARNGLWYECQFPDGWQIKKEAESGLVIRSFGKKAPANSTAYEIYDPEGNQRAVIHVSYSRHHHTITIKLFQRYQLGSFVVNQGRYEIYDRKKRAVIWSGDVYDAKDEIAVNDADLAAYTELKTRFPDHEDPFMYWQDE